MKPLALAAGVAGAAVLAVGLAGSPASAGRSTDDGYNRSTLPAVSAAPGVFAPDTTPYVEPEQALITSWTLEPKSRGFVIVLVDGQRFACPAGKIFGNTNPFVVCDLPGDDQVVLDYPPYGNATKKTMAQACSTFTDDKTTAVTTAPAGCLAEVHVTLDGVTQPVTYQSLPFTMTQTKG